MCEECNPDICPHNQLTDNDTVCITSTVTDSQFEIAPVSKTIEKTLKERLAVYRDSLISETLEHTTALIGINLCTGLTDRNISLVATNCLHVHSE